ncbi:MAG TPA: beta-ketoacyl synthase N-terminal-like domain-containing protein, partial [Gemmataceae bacterium]|nr:beta-ketoacyl synthase N-terminal-like domain-containing protein [Gemmataceae bacterium]
MRRRVVITGMGAVTPLGHGVAETFRALCEGKSGVGPIRRFNASRFPTTFAAEVKDFDLGRWVKDPGRFGDTGVNTQFALAAARQALEDAGLLDGQHPGVDRTRFGTYFGSGEGIQDFHNLLSLIAQSYRGDSRRVDVPAFVRGGMAQFHPGRESEQELHTTSAHVA